MPHCPSDAELLRLALTAGPVTGHVGECVRCQRELAELRDAAAGLREGEVPRPDRTAACLKDNAIAALAEGVPGGRVPQPGLDHLAGCGHCRERVAEVSRLLRNEQVAAEVRHLEAPVDGSGRRRRWFRLAGGLAAAAVLVLVFRTIGMPHQRDVQLREEPVTLISAPVPLQPTGTVARVDSLSWRSVPRATQYRLTLFTQEGETVWDSGTSDTVVALPTTVHLVAGATYYWKVEARTDWNRWTASDMVEIQIRRGP